MSVLIFSLGLPEIIVGFGCANFLITLEKLWRNY